MALGGIRKPSYYGFALLHRLGNERLTNASKNALVTRRSDGTLVIAAWNLVDPDRAGKTRSMTFSIHGVAAGASASVSRVDAESGNVLAAYEEMGRPQHPTLAQVHELNRESQPTQPDVLQLQGGRITLRVPVNGLALLEIPRAPAQ
jgi:xylan 1,4-beta-xylosidase